jgi:hypothetical protein
MRSGLVAILTATALCGCSAGPPWAQPPGPMMPVRYDNPTLIPIADHQYVWDAVVDVIGNYFKIDREDPVRLLGNTLTEGRIETYPKTGATLFEPWDQDSANGYERLESTLQSIRRRAVVRVIPAQGGGFWVDVAVFKELENMAAPEHATAGTATFRSDIPQTRIVNPQRVQELNRGWISQGRDMALEQRIVGQLHYRFSPAGRPMPL